MSVNSDCYEATNCDRVNKCLRRSTPYHYQQKIYTILSRVENNKLAENVIFQCKESVLRLEQKRQCIMKYLNEMIIELDNVITMERLHVIQLRAERAKSVKLSKRNNLDNNVDSQACFSIEVNIDENLSSNLDNIDFSEINIEEYLGKEGIDLSIFDSL
jgi:hypothetical protein